jgi:hypothetical protein
LVSWSLDFLVLWSSPDAEMRDPFLNIIWPVLVCVSVCYLFFFFCSFLYDDVPVFFVNEWNEDRQYVCIESIIPSPSPDSQQNRSQTLVECVDPDPKP